MEDYEPDVRDATVKRSREKISVDEREFYDDDK